MVQIFDCVEFNRDLRCADVASDLAFLLMDLTRLGASEVATSLLARYREAGLDLPDELLRLYSAHRALVRAKIAGLELPGSGREEAARHMAEATDYLDLASARGPHCAASPRGHDRAQWDRQVDGGTAPCTGAGGKAVCLRRRAQGTRRDRGASPGRLG